MVSKGRTKLNRLLPTCLSLVLPAVLMCGGITMAQGTTPDAMGSGVPHFDGVQKSVSGGIVEAILFYIFGGTVLAAAIGVCVSKRVVRMATWLFGTLGGVAVLYFLLGANYLGVIQLIVYAGGTLILLVFGVMLTSKSPWVRFECPRGEMVVASVVSILLFASLTTVLVTAEWPAQSQSADGVRIAEFGKELLTTYLVPFEVASVMLLVVMIAAAYLARQDRDDSEGAN